MEKKLNRRDFVRSAAAAGIAAAAPRTLFAQPSTHAGQGPTVLTRKSVKLNCESDPSLARAIGKRQACRKQKILR